QLAVVANDADARLRARAEIIGERVPRGDVLERRRALGHVALEDPQARDRLVLEALAELRVERAREVHVGDEEARRDDADRGDEEAEAEPQPQWVASSGEAAKRYPTPRTVRM